MALYEMYFSMSVGIVWAKLNRFSTRSGMINEMILKTAPISRGGLAIITRFNNSP
jgi:hypothetical protein